MLSGEARAQFIEANNLVARALGDDASLAIDLNGSVENLPLGVAAPQQAEDYRLYRGLADALALIHVHHNADLHIALSPSVPLLQRIFSEMERARCEACCQPGLLGVRHNMATLWCDTRGRIDRADTSDPELLPAIFGLLTRHAIGTPVAITETAQALVDHWRDTIGQPVLWRSLAAHVAHQNEFATVALQLINRVQLTGGSAQAASSAPLMPADQDDEPEETDDKDSVVEEMPSDEQDQPLTVTLRDEPEDDIDTSAANSSDASQDDIELVNRDAPVNVDSEHVGAVDTRRDGEYRVFTKAYDEVVVADRFCSAEDLAELRRALDVHLDRHARVVGKLSGKLQRVLMTQQQRHWMFDLDEGILDAARLARVVTDPTAALSFKQESEMPFKDTVVTVLVDNSKSMLGKPIAIAAACSDLLSQTLERCGVSVEILGFTTTQLHGGEQYDEWKQGGAASNPGRLNGLRHIIYKAADTPYRRARRCFGLMLQKDLLKQNIDGEALLWAWERLRRRPERRKILLVISDGAPIDTSTMAANDGNFLIDHLHQVIAKIESRAEVELVAIGIGHDVTGYYKNAMTILDARELGRSMLAKLSTLFQQP